MSRNYWYKMKQDFFDTVEAKCLLSEANGEACMIVYLQLSCRAVSSDGVILFRHSRDTIAQELAAYLGKKPKKIEEFLKTLQKNGFLEVLQDGSILLPKILENTGSESDSAERMRRFRARHDVQKSDDIQRRDRPEKEKEKESEARADSSPSGIHSEDDEDEGIGWSIPDDEWRDPYDPSEDLYFLYDFRKTCEEEHIDLTETQIEDIYKRLKIAKWTVNGEPIKSLGAVLRAEEKWLKGKC